MSSFEHDTPDLAAQYDRLSNSQFESGKRLAERLGIKEGMRVLDVGSGTGRLARHLAGMVGPTGSVIGIEPLAERVDLAEKQTSQTTVAFEVGQAEDLRAFPDAHFDVVCMTAVLHWVEDKAKALAEVRRVLKPGGRLGVTTLPQELASAGSIARILQSIFESEHYSGKVDVSAITFARNRVTTSDLIGLILGAKLHLQELHVTERTVKHATEEAMLAFLDASAFGNFLRIVSDEARPRFHDDLIRAFGRMREGDDVVSRDWGLLFIALRVD